MPAKRIGELLSEFVPLSRHDIDEILQEQSVRTDAQELRRHRAVAGPVPARACLERLVRPARRRAAAQDQSRQIGIDTQALTFVTAETAHELAVLLLGRCSAIPHRRDHADAIGLAATASAAGEEAAPLRC